MGERVKQLLRFCAVGAACLGLSAAVLVGLHALAGVNYLLAYAASFITGNIAGYLLNARFTFAVRAVSHVGASRYMLVNATLLGANTVALDLLVQRMHIWYLAAAVHNLPPEREPRRTEHLACMLSKPCRYTATAATRGPQNGPTTEAHM